jgi:predicted dehydrogenase
MKKLRVAIIGSGHIAQWMHIPYLRELDDRYEIVATCDISQQLVERVAGYFQIPGRYTDYRRMLDEVRPDACLIATLDHYDPALASIEAGAHVLVEKPMCILLSEAEQLAARAEKLGRIVQVGYHKRYDPNYQRGLDLMQGVEKRRLLYLRCLIGPNARYNNDFWPGWRYDDLPPVPSVAAKFREAVGTDVPDKFVAAYGLLGGLSTHTFSIFRGLYPELPKVHAFKIAADGRSYSALMETSDGVIVTMDTGVIDVKSFDEEMSLFAHDHVVKINFPSPYLKNAETHVMMQTMNGDERVEQHFLASNEEAYKREWKAFYESIVNGAPVVTPAKEGVMDVQLNQLLLEAARQAENSSQ